MHPPPPPTHTHVQIHSLIIPSAHAPHTHTPSLICPPIPSNTHAILHRRHKHSVPPTPPPVCPFHLLPHIQTHSCTLPPPHPVHTHTSCPPPRLQTLIHAPAHHWAATRTHTHLLRHARTHAHTHTQVLQTEGNPTVQKHYCPVCLG